MNLEEYHQRIANAHSVTGVPSYWEDLQTMTEERDLWKRGVIHLVEIQDCNKTNCELCEEIFSAYEKATRV
jgi:hypothetical protein